MLWVLAGAAPGSIRLMGIEGFQKQAVRNSYQPVDAPFIRAHRDLCCSTCGPGRDV